MSFTPKTSPACHPPAFFRTLLLVSVLIAAVLIVPPASAAEVTRSVMVDPSTGDATITLTVQGLADGGIAEVLPDGWRFREFKQVEGVNRVVDDGKVIAVRVNRPGPVTYRASTGDNPSGRISGLWEDYTTLTNGTVLDTATVQGPAPVQTKQSPGFSVPVLLVSLGAALCVLCLGRKEEARS